MTKSNSEPGAYVLGGNLFFRLLDGTTISCNCIAGPHAEQVLKVFNAQAASIAAAAAPFARIANILDELGDTTLEHTTPLRNVVPGTWPTVGDIRRLRDVLVRMGWKP